MHENIQSYLVITDIYNTRNTKENWLEICNSLCEHTHIRFFKPGFHKDMGTRRIAYLTQFSIPAFLNPMITKMADTVTYDWSTALCLCLCLCRPSFHLSKLPDKYKHKHKKNELVRFSCAYAYVDPFFTCLRMCLCLCLCASENQALLRFGQNEVYLLTLGSLLGFST